jgi:hypothetical protein
LEWSHHCLYVFEELKLQFNYLFSSFMFIIAIYWDSFKLFLGLVDGPLEFFLDFFWYVDII